MVKYIILPLKKKKRQQKKTTKKPQNPKTQESHPSKIHSSFVSAFHNLQFSLELPVVAMESPNEPSTKI